MYVCPKHVEVRMTYYLCWRSVPSINCSVCNVLSSLSLRSCPCVYIENIVLLNLIHTINIYKGQVFPFPFFL